MIMLITVQASFLAVITSIYWLTANLEASFRLADCHASLNRLQFGDVQGVPLDVWRLQNSKRMFLSEPNFTKHCFFGGGWRL